MLTRLLDHCNNFQHKYSAGTDCSNINQHKLKAKEIGLTMLNDSLNKSNSNLVIDIGGEDFYQKFLPNGTITKWNLPNDMHKYIDTNRYDGAIAMHVLEHSPCPLLVLYNINECLKDGGVLYIAVPRPTPFFENGFPDHLTMMSPDMWKKLILLSGFEIISQSTGQFNPDPTWLEERFLCVKR